MPVVPRLLIRVLPMIIALALCIGFWSTTIPAMWRVIATGLGGLHMQQQTRAAEAVTGLDAATIASIEERAYRAGYGAGADSAQQERRRKPFLIEDEAWSQFRKVG